MNERKVFEIRPCRGGWKAFEAHGVEPFYIGLNAKRDAIHYVKNCRTGDQHGEIRIYNAAGDLEETIPFDNRRGSQRD